MLSGQLSYGTGDKNCCPDTTNTTSVQLLTATVQTQLDQLQAESLLIDANIPSLDLHLPLKTPFQKSIMEQVHAESGLLNDHWSNSLASQLEVQLKNRILNNQKYVVVNAQ